jgi:TRAP transporter TAXI family solute receptor
MKKSIAVTTAFLLVAIGSINVFANRTISAISDLDHEKGKIGTYRALVIGIQNYQDPRINDLDTPLNDARQMSDILKSKYGFKVDRLLDQEATRKAIYNALRNLSNIAKPEDSILIYYAGHGDLDRTYNDGWWIPVDAKGGEPDTYLDNIHIQRAMAKMKARHVLLISDSCYSGTLFGQTRSIPNVIDDKYYLNLYNEKSRWGITSGNKTPVSDTGSGGHSIFAYQLIKELQNNTKPYISAQELYTNIAPIIANNSEQQPICKPIIGTGDMGGQFIFVTLNKASDIKHGRVEPKLHSAPPSSDRISFEDILKAGEKQEANRKKWLQWQTNREKDYSLVQQIDAQNHLTAAQKKEAWKRFLSAISHDNPYSDKDDEMRNRANKRVSYWNNEKSVEKPNINSNDAREQDYHASLKPQVIDPVYKNTSTFLTIGTGGVTGVYYPTGGAIARLVNKGRKDHGIRVSVESSGGSVHNLNAIAAGDYEIGIAQSDWHYHAYNGTNRFKSKGANRNLRSIFSVHPEPFTVIARADSGIRQFNDLKGKRVNIGNPGSGQRGTMEIVMLAKGWTKSDFKLASELKTSEQAAALCDNKLDAVIYTVGHPSGSIKHATDSCNVRIIPVTGPAIDKLIGDNSFYRKAVVPGGMYRGNPHDVATFGVGATVVTSSSVPDGVIYHVVKSVFENFDQFRRLHPAFANLKKREMVEDSLSAPLHKGAKEYYSRAGLL